MRHDIQTILNIILSVTIVMIIVYLGFSNNQIKPDISINNMRYIEQPQENIENQNQNLENTIVGIFDDCDIQTAKLGIETVNNDINKLIHLKHKSRNKSKYNNLETPGRQSSFEKITKQVLDELFPGYTILYNVRYDFNKSPHSRYNLEYDFVIEDLRFAVEYNGGFHAERNTYYRDRAKMENAVNNGVYLITIPEQYKTYDSIKDYIIRDLAENSATSASIEYKKLTHYKKKQIIKLR